MSIKIKFDLTGNPELPTIILANRNGNKLGQLNVNADSVDLIDKLNDASEISFTVNKYVNDEPTPLWDKLVDFKLIWCKEWDLWFEIKVELDEETETVKTVFCTQLGQAELSQTILHNVEINTEDDIKRDDYKIAILYDEKDPEASILDRTLEKAPHYRIIHVDDTIKNIQRSFSFDDVSIVDSHQKIAEEVGCLFVYHSNSDQDGKIQRTISVYDLQQNCLNPECNYRGEFTDKCPKCGGTNIKYGFGTDTLIFVTSDELASEGIELVADIDSVKNCFKLEGGDDLMTATIRNCNPNGTDYLWYFSEDVKEDMSDELVDRLNSYDNLYKDYCNNYESKLNANLVNKYNDLVKKYEGFYNTESTCLNCDNKAVFDGACPKCGSKNVLSGKILRSIPQTIKGYAPLMNAYYNTIDLALYLKSGLMPSVQMSDTNAKEQVGLLTPSSLSPVAVNTENLSSVSLATADSAVLSMAKIIVKPTYKVEINKSYISELLKGKDKNGKEIEYKTWTGSFIVTNYSDETDTAESQTIEIVVNNNTETFVKQKIDKSLNKEDTDDYSISGLFKFKKKDEDDNSYSFEFEKELNVDVIDGENVYSGAFYDELKKYALNPLKSLYDACDACINILIDQGAGDKDGNPDIYENLYQPYYQRSSAISEEIKLREEEIAVIEGVWSKNKEDGQVLILRGLQQYIENCRNKIHDELDFEKYLGEDLLLEFCSYRREDTYSNENYISNGLNNNELFKRALEFIEVAENEIYKSAELQNSISTSLNNLLSIDKFEDLIDSFELGNWIRVRIDDKIFKLRLIEYEIDFGNFENISVEFSDATKIKNGTTDVQDVLSQASSMATSYSSIQRQARQGDDAKGTVDNWLTSGLNSALVKIQNNNDEEVVLNKNGLLCRSYDDISESYSPEQFRLTHNILAYTTDNWETVSAALGKHDYNYYDSNQELKIGTDYGLSSKFVTAGYISGSQIIGGEIYSQNYSPTSGTYLDLDNGHFTWAGGKIKYDGDIVTLDGVEISWKNTNEIPQSSVSGLEDAISGIDDAIGRMDNAISGLDGAVKTSEQVVKDYVDNKDSTLKNDLTTSYEAYANSKVGELDTAVGKYLGLSGSTLVGNTYVVSPYIGGGYLNIANTKNNARVIIDPNNLTGNGYIFQVHNGSGVSLGITKDGSASFAGKVTASSGEITGNLNISGSLTHTDGDYTVTLRGVQSNKTHGVFYITDKSSGSNVYPFRINGDGSFLATKGEIAGWTIDSDKLFTKKTSNRYGTGISTTSSGSDPAFYAGFSSSYGENPWKHSKNPDIDKDWRSYTNFYVTHNGDLHAKSGTFGGTLNAADGTFKGILSAVSGSFTSLTAGKSKFSTNQVIIDASYTNSQGQAMSKGSVYIGQSGYTDSNGTLWDEITIRPSKNNLGNIGTTNYSWDMLCVKNGVIHSSDRNYKRDISAMGEKQEQLFNLLTPVKFKFIDSTYDRFHYGYISQDVEDALLNVGLTTKDFAGFCKDIKRNEDGTPVLDENGNPEYIYSLRYTEFIALNTHMIQKLQSENQILKGKIDSLEQMIKQLL